MESATLPDNEVERLAALYRYDVLDSPPEAMFNELTELAANICDAPIALISLVDESRQWFKARVGLDARETARSVSFCAHAILQPGLFVVPDTLQDARFADNPLVTDSPHIRFYAGAPLLTPEGHGLGTLCVIDQVPRELSARQQKALRVLRTHILKLLELQRITRELEISNRELDTYSFAVSHELRTPLRGISGFSEMLMTDHAAHIGIEARDLLQRIHDAARQMDQTTADLLGLSRISHHPLQFWRVDLGHLAQEAASALRAAAPARSVDLVIHPGLITKGDPVLLGDVVERLLDNAWKFTAHRDHARIEFGATQQDGRIEYFVRDNGCGFEMAYASKLFRPFQRLHRNADYSGSGLGLATAKHIIERHGGTIRAESTLDQGATIYFTLHNGRKI